MPNSSGFEIFRDSENLYKRVRPRKRLILALLALFLIVAAANGWWLYASLTRPALVEELEEHARSSAQRVQTLERIKARTGEAEAGLSRLGEGDRALRDSLHLDREARQAAQGQTPSGERTASSLALQTRMEVRSAFSRALNRPVKLAACGPDEVRLLLAQAPAMIGTAPDAWPVRGMISSDFGVRLSPFAGQEEFHKGVDIMAPAGSPVAAPAPGVAVFAGEDAEGTLAVVLDHGGGYVTTFSHMHRLEVKPGERVERGQDIGSVGQEGRSTGPHLHYEVRLHGLPVDPRKYLP
jgi:murein DD-endopeptidase MepM/ murein hydrolase activator NlpD